MRSIFENLRKRRCVPSMTSCGGQFGVFHETVSSHFLPFLPFGSIFNQHKFSNTDTAILGKMCLFRRVFVSGRRCCLCFSRPNTPTCFRNIKVLCGWCWEGNEKKKSLVFYEVKELRASRQTILYSFVLFFILKYWKVCPHAGECEIILCSINNICPRAIALCSEGAFLGVQQSVQWENELNLASGVGINPIRIHSSTMDTELGIRCKCTDTDPAEEHDYGACRR